jgi:hypothetical protein
MMNTEIGVEEFKGWEDMSRKEQLEAIVYDMYKDAYGVRGRHLNLQSMTEEELDREVSYLQGVIIENESRQRDQEKAAARAFEERIGEYIAVGAGNRETALRWIMEADGDGYNDWEYVAFVNGLPYGYFKAAA